MSAPTECQAGRSVHGSVDMATAWSVQEFMYREALALDERRYRDWLAMLADDIRYEVPGARDP